MRNQMYAQDAKKGTEENAWLLKTLNSSHNLESNSKNLVSVFLVYENSKYERDD